MAEHKIDELVAEIENLLQAQPDVLAAYLFGSVSEGREGPLSDVDIAVLFRPGLAQDQMWHMEDALGVIVSQRLPGYTIDLMALNLSPLRFRFEVISKGQAFYSADDSQRADFESYTLRRYWDLKKYLSEYRTNLIARAKEEFNETQRAQYRDTLDQVAAVHRRIKESAGA
jgi:predicted nucleotidyltransferase